MAQKQPSLPRRYRKAMKAKTFRRTVLGRIHLDRDRAFVDECFETREDGSVVARSDLDAAAVKRLRGVLKEIKKNRGLVKRGRITVVLLILAAALVFNLVFKNRLVESAGESALEAQFLAQSDIVGLDLRLLSGQLTIEGITVADRDQPMRNLIDLGPTVLSINTVELLKGKAVVERATIADLRFDTPRERSGALPAEELARLEAARSQIETGRTTQRVQDARRAVADEMGLGSIDLAALSSLSADPQAIVAAAVAELSAPAIAEAAAAEAQAIQERWTTRLAATEDQVRRLEELAATVQNRDYGGIDTLQEAQTAATELQTVVREAQALYQNVESAGADLRSDIAAVEAQGSAIQSAIEADYNELRNRLPDVSVDPQDMAHRIVAASVRGFLGDSYDQGLVLLQRAQALRSQLPERSRGPGRGGVDIPFGGREYPRVFVRVIDGSGVLPQGDPDSRFQARLTNLSSDADLVGAPMELQLLDQRSAGTTEVQAAVDLRSEASALARYTVVLSGRSPALPPGARELGFDRLNGDMDLEVAGEFEDIDSLSGEMNVRVGAPDLQSREGGSAVTSMVAATVSEAQELTAAVDFRLDGGRFEDLSVATNLAALLSDRIDAVVAELRSTVEAQLRDELDQRVQEALAPYRRAMADMENLTDLSREQLRSAEASREIVAERQAAVEAEAAGYRRELEDRARAEAEQRSRAAEEQAREEAEDRLQDAADSLNIPGFGN